MRGPLVCRTCEDAARDAQVESDLSIRQHNADVPERFRPYRLDRVERMPAGADLSQWRLELGRMRPVAIGIHPGNVRAWQACCGYKPDSAGLWLHGPVGTGKTLLAAALATKLVAPWVPLTEEEIRKLAPKRVKYRLRRDVAPTAMCDVQDLLDRTRLSWSGDRDPLGRLSRIQVLILDDLGAVTLPEFGRDAIARVVDLRYRSRLPLIVTSNVEPEALHESLGERTASRLASLCRNVVPVRGPDFRTGGA
jgi:DNA replication protein DnaC